MFSLSGFDVHLVLLGDPTPPAPQESELNGDPILAVEETVMFDVTDSLHGHRDGDLVRRRERSVCVRVGECVCTCV